MPWDSYTKFLSHFDGADGAQAYTAETGQVITFVGTAQLDTANKKFGSASLLLAAAGDYCSVPTSADWDFGSGDFTVDFQWFVPNAAFDSFYMLSHDGTAGARGWFITHQGNLTQLRFSYTTDGSTQVHNYFTFSPTINTFYHIEFDRSGNNLYCFVNGSQVGSTVDMTGVTIYNPASIPLYIGAVYGGVAGGDAPSQFDEVRVSKGIARHTANFTPPTNPYVPLENASVSPSAQSLTLTQNTPTVIVHVNTSVSPIVQSLHLTQNLPSITTHINVSTSPAVQSLALAHPSPSISTQASINVSPSTQSLVLTRNAPIVIAHSNTSISVTAQSLSLTRNSPTVTAHINVSTSPAVQSLALAHPSPSISTQASINVSPSTQSLVLTRNAPIVIAHSNTSISVTAQSLSLTRNSPTVTAHINVSISPAVQLLHITQNAPSVVITGINASISPSHQALVLSLPSGISSYGPNSPGTVVDDATVGTVTWIPSDMGPLLSDIQANDTKYAVAPNTRSTKISHYLKATNFNFPIPIGKTITGILVEIKRKTHDSDNQAVDSSIRIVKSDGSFGSQNKSTGAAWSYTESYVSFGSASDLWNESWLYSDINNAKFGVAFSATLNPVDYICQADVNHIRITVYCLVEGAKVSISANISPTVQSLSLSLSVPTVTTHINVSISPLSFGLTLGIASPVIQTIRIINISVSSLGLSLTRNDPSIEHIVNISPTVQSLALHRYSPSIKIDEAVLVIAQKLSLNLGINSVRISLHFSPSSLSLSLVLEKGEAGLKFNVQAQSLHLSQGTIEYILVVNLSIASQSLNLSQGNTREMALVIRGWISVIRKYRSVVFLNTSKEIEITRRYRQEVVLQNRGDIEIIRKNYIKIVPIGFRNRIETELRELDIKDHKRRVGVQSKELYARNLMNKVEIIQKEFEVKI